MHKSKRKKPGNYFKSPLQDWILGPKTVEDDSEEGEVEMEGEQRLSISSMLTGKDMVKMEEEKKGLLPGFHQDGGCYRSSSSPPLKSAITSSYPGEKRMSIYSVTFASPVTPYGTSL